ncbi:MAG: PIN domain-containing protein [Eggerthellaceae bacterium]|nr:PIN domain-containing protein [Eggerthellaceae bacterium]
MKRRFLVDTNVVLDLLLAREAFYLDALQIFAMAEAGKVELLLSTDAVSTIYYVVAKNRGASAGRQAVLTLLDYVSLAALDERCVLDAVALEFTDIEDALVAAVAHKSGVSGIITRNGKDFFGSPVPAISPREFLALGCW